MVKAFLELEWLVHHLHPLWLLLRSLGIRVSWMILFLGGKSLIPGCIKSLDDQLELCKQCRPFVKEGNRFLCRHIATAPRIKLCHQSMQIHYSRNTSVTLYLYISQRNMRARFVPAGMSTNAAFITNATSTYKCTHFKQLINGQLFWFCSSLLRCNIFLSNYGTTIAKTHISAKAATT